MVISVVDYLCRHYDKWQGRHACYDAWQYFNTTRYAYGCRYETFRIDWLGIEVMLLNLPGSGILWLGVRGSAWCGWHKQLMTAVATLSLSGYDSVTCDVVQVTEVCCCRSVCVCVWYSLPWWCNSPQIITEFTYWKTSDKLFSYFCSSSLCVASICVFKLLYSTSCLRYMKVQISSIRMT